jgi:hypothetical protein
VDEIEEHLRRVIADAETELGRLGRHPQAWQEINAYLTDTMPVFGFGAAAEAMLGPMASKNGAGVIPTRKLRAFRAIERQAKRCRQCRAAIANVPDDFVGHVTVVQAQEHHQALFRRYIAELKKPSPPAIQEMPAWSAAYRAATATAALKNLDSPMALFAAGAFLEGQRLMAWAAGTLLPQANARARSRFKQGVALGRMPAVEALAVRRARSKAATAQQLERRKSLEPVREAVRQVYQRLRGEGDRATVAARKIATDPRIREHIREIARQTGGPTPWRGAFYSYGAIRKIVDL